MRVTTLLCGPWDNLWPFYETVFSLYILYTNPYIRMLRNNADARRCSYFELGLPVITLTLTINKLPRMPETLLARFPVSVKSF